MTCPSPVVRARSLTRTFRRGGIDVAAVRAADLTVERGEVVALVGSSGSGKSTLLTMIVGWERPDSGELTVCDLATSPSALGWDDIAVVPQALGLLTELSMWENVLLPARALRAQGSATSRAIHLMERLEIAHLRERRPPEVSLGEQQRCAFARGLVLRPTLVVADEPTAHQDHRFVRIMLDVMRAEAATGTAFLVATHNAAAAASADRVLTMRDGRLEISS